MSSPQRFQVKRLRAVCQYVPGSADIVELIQRRIDRIRRNTGFGAYLLADSDGYVYLLRAESGVCEHMVSRLPRMVVGMYLNASAEQIADDLEQHISDLTLSPVGVQSSVV